MTCQELDCQRLSPILPNFRMDDLATFDHTNFLTHRTKPLILAVDDDEDSLLLVACAIDLFDCSAVVARDGPSALKLALSERPDLILLDILLPHLSGFDLIEQLKSNPLTTTIPIVALTALASTQDRDRLLRAGCDDYLSKPYMLDDLETVVNRYLSLPFTLF